MGEWREYKLGDICEIYDGPHATPPKQNDGYIFLGISNLGFDGRVNHSAFEYVSAESFKKWTKRVTPHSEDIVFSYETKLGVAGIIPKNFKCCLGRRMGLLRPKDGIYPRFLLYAYLGPDFQKVIYERTYHGSTVDRIPLREMADFPISIPPLPEQRAIASVLSSLDDKIDLLHRQNKTLEAMAETLFRQWFVEEAQDDWEELDLGYFINIKHGYAFKGKYITTEVNDNILVTPGNVKIGGGFKCEKMKYFWGSDFPMEYVFSPGDLIVTMTDLSKEGDTLGYPALIPIHNENQIKYLHNQRIGKVEFKQNISKYFLYSLMKAEDYRWYILGSASGTSVSHTSPTSICKYQFKVPPMGKIQKFDKITNELMAKVNMNQSQIQTLEKLRDTLLPKLMTGEVRVECLAN